MAKIEDKLLDHNFDGIQEYDNPLPPWWVYLFVLSIIWGGVYFFYYHISGLGPSSKDEYAQEIKDYETKYASLIKAENSVDWNNPNFEPVTDKAKIDKAKSLFLKNCVACHGNAGEGGIGPNLTDDYWIHGNTINDIAKTIALGVPEKGMITWKTSLKKDDIVSLASFILTLRGTNPPNQKAPQGNLYKY